MGLHERNDRPCAAARTRRNRSALALSSAALLLTPAIAAAAGTETSTPGASASGNKPKVEVLSNLKSETQWAYPKAAAAAHSAPSSHARVVGHLVFLTAEGHIGVYLALKRETIKGSSWLEVPLPGKPNGRTGWVPESALGELHTLHSYLRVDRETERITLYRNGKQIFSAPVGTGAPDLPTPAGHFYIREKFPVIGDPFYGPDALGTSAYQTAPDLGEWPGGGVVGIHGTNEPQLIPGHPSHGCIRLKNEDIAKLYKLVEVGTPLEIV